MKHRVAVGANRPQISDRIDRALALGFRHRSHVMHVDEAIAEPLIPLGELKSTDEATAAEVRNAPASGLGISLVGVHGHTDRLPFDEQVG